VSEYEPVQILIPAPWLEAFQAWANGHGWTVFRLGELGDFDPPVYAIAKPDQEQT
jgi:hypothetical protein